MSLFAVFGLACLTVFLYFSDRKVEISSTSVRDGQPPVLEFVKGFFYAVPCVILVVILRRYIPISYRGFPLYARFLCTDHLLPAVFLGGLYFLAYTQKGFPRLLLFGGGFYTLLGIVEILTHYGQYEPYHLLLLPAVRMGGLMFLTIFFLRYQEWYGMVRVLFLVLLVCTPFLSGVITYLYMRSYLPWAAVLAALFFLGSLVYTYLERRTPLPRQAPSS